MRPPLHVQLNLIDAHPQVKQTTRATYSSGRIRREALSTRAVRQYSVPTHPHRLNRNSRMPWLKALHIIFMVTWFAGLFYLPRLFVYHAQCEDTPGRERFKIMERKLFYGIMTPGAVLTVTFGLWMVFAYAWELYSSMAWLHIKLTLMLGLVAYHVYCGKLLIDFRHDRNRHGHVFYRWLNEVPVLFLIVIVLLATLKPF
jgi:putative membrane protein